MSSETSESDTETEQINEYEQQRIVRIAENQAKLQSLGLRGAVKFLSGSSEASGRHRIAVNSKAVIKAGRTRQASLPRRSARIRQEPAPTHRLRRGSADSTRSTSARVYRSPPSGVPGPNQGSFADLNQHRIATMSETALRNRIHKIRNVPKMCNFIEELKETDLLHLVSEAKDALSVLTGDWCGKR